MNSVNEAQENNFMGLAYMPEGTIQEQPGGCDEWSPGKLRCCG